MDSDLLRDTRLWEQLLRVDQDLADTTRQAGCTCGGVLHRANYPRKPRGAPAGLGRDFALRLSFCCAREGCRGRTTPASVRFLGRRVYLAAVVVLASAMQGGITAKRAARLHALVGVSFRTLKRWRAWWRAGFTDSAFWRGVRGRFSPPVDVQGLSGSLLERFSGKDERERLIQTLAFLGPLTTTSASKEAGS